MRRTHRLQLFLSDVEKRWLEELAERQGVSRADVLRFMLAHQKRLQLGMMKTTPEHGRRPRGWNRGKAAS